MVQNKEMKIIYGNRTTTIVNITDHKYIYILFFYLYLSFLESLFFIEASFQSQQYDILKDTQCHTLSTK